MMLDEERSMNGRMENSYFEEKKDFAFEALNTAIEESMR